MRGADKHSLSTSVSLFQYIVNPGPRSITPEHLDLRQKLKSVQGCESMRVLDKQLLFCSRLYFILFEK